MNNNQGWINLYKPKNLSSFQAIKKIKKNFSIEKIGHAGTLDPLAEGILPVALGKTTKLIPFVAMNLKKYKFTITWGSQTSTDDISGSILHTSDNFPSQNKILSNLKNYIGIISQVPPTVSAVKINGKRAYKLARENKKFQISSKNVYIKNLKLIKYNQDSSIFEIECGKGFYIRSLARDFARDLGTFGHISSLERLKVGRFTKESSIFLDDLLKIGKRLADINCVRPSVSMLDDILAYEIVDENDLKDISMGKTIKIDEKKLENISLITTEEKDFFLSNNGDIVSIGKLNRNLFKPKKVLI
tara:strand:- start:160 stop:1065 length:906 start_codon:yes stop_codon:yes gene_type:complete